MLPYSQPDLDMTQKRLDGRTPFPIGVDTRRPNSREYNYHRNSGSRGKPRRGKTHEIITLYVIITKFYTEAILLDVCYMLITLLMVYGAVRGKPSYLMPFFVLKVFEFCIYWYVSHISAKVL